MRNILELIGGLIPGNTTTYEAPKPKAYKTRAGDITEEDLNELRAVLFGEISNRASDKQRLEARTIINTAINRMSQYKEKGKDMTLAQVLQAPNQYQAYGGGEYSRIKTGGTKPTDQQKIQAIDDVIGTLKEGLLPDTTGGRVFYVHEPDGRIILKDGTLYKKSRPTFSELTGN